MTIDHGRIKALFQAAIDREDPAEPSSTSTAKSAMTPIYAIGWTTCSPSMIALRPRSTAPSMPAPWPLKTSSPATHPDVNN